MKKLLLYRIVHTLLFLTPLVYHAQTPNLGTAATFVLFSTDGAVTNSGVSQLTGNVGSNNGSSTGFGNVNGGMHDGDAASIQGAADLLIAYNQLNSAIPTFFPTSLLGNGQTIYAGVNSIAASASLNLNLILDAQGNPNAVFIFQIQGAFSTAAGSKIELLNGALACNVFWKVEGLVSMAAGTSMKGNIIANNAAIAMGSGCTLEGRALSIIGAVTVDGILGYTPIGCGSPVLTGPQAPNLGTAACYAIFSGDGAVTNAGITNIIGDVGSNNGAAIGYDPLLVSGLIHMIPDASTALCASDLLAAYNSIYLLANDIELLFPAQFGNNLVLTPHTYIMNGAATFTDSLYLNAQGNAEGVFVIKIIGAMSTSTYSKVILMNGAQAKNVYWMIEGAVDLNNYSVFNGTIICNNAALGSIGTGVVLNGRALTTVGALSTNAMSGLPTNIPGNCAFLGLSELENMDESFTLYPNPFTNAFTITTDKIGSNQVYEIKLLNTMGKEVMKSTTSGNSTEITIDNIPSGIYFYNIILNDRILQTGKVIAN